MIFRGGSGSGINLSNIRGSMEPLAKGGTASGPVSFMRGADAWAGTIKSGGKTRRAAKMVVLDVDHPDIREFIWCKAKEEDKAAALRDAGFDMSIDGDGFQSIQYQNANNSVRVTDEFMQRRRGGRRVAADRAHDRRAGRRADPRARADARDRRGGLALRRPGRAVRHDDQPLAHLPELRADQRVEPVLGVHARRRLGLQPRLAEPDEVPPRGRHASTSSPSSTPSTSMLLAQEIVVGPSSYPTEEIGVNARAFRQLGLGYANLGAYLMATACPTTPTRAADRRRDHRADDRPRLPRSARVAGGARPVRALRGEPRAAQRRDAHAPRRLLRDRRRRAARTASCSPRRARSWDEAVALGERHGYRNAQATVLAPTGTISLPDGLRHDRRRAGLLAGQVQGARRRRADDDRQPHGAAGAADARLLRAADRADRGPPRRARHDRRRARPRRRAPAGVRRRRRRARDLAHGPHQDDGRRPAVHLGRDLEDRQPARRRRRSRTSPTPTRRPGGSASRRSRSTATARRPRRRCAPTRRRQDAQEPVDVDAIVAAGRREGARRGRARGASGCRASASRSRTSSRSAATRATSPPACTRTARVGEIFLTDIGKEGSTLRGMMNSFATAISIALQYGVPLETLVQKFSYMRFEPEGITGNPEIPFAKSMPDYIMRWLASRFLDADAQEELGILTPAVRARKAAQEAAQSSQRLRHRRPAASAIRRGRRRRATAATAARSAADGGALTDTPAGRPGAPAGPRPRPRVQPVRRHDAAHGLLLHVLELRQQHRLRLSHDRRRISASSVARVRSTLRSCVLDLLGSRGSGAQWVTARSSSPNKRRAVADRCGSRPAR